MKQIEYSWFEQGFIVLMQDWYVHVCLCTRDRPLERIFAAD